MEKDFSWVGVGLRPPHHEYFLQNKRDVEWLEIHSENFFQPHSDALQDLLKLRRTYSISCHCVGLSLGSSDPMNKDHLTQLKELIHKIDPLFISDHLSWSSIDGQYFNDLLPLPYTEEALDLFCQKVNECQEYLQRQILIENPSSYLRFHHSTIPEWEFLNHVAQRTGCGLLLDLNNIYVSAFNHGFNIQEYLNGLDARLVKEIHLAGFTINPLKEGEIWIDTHNKPVCSQVWDLFDEWTKKHGPRHTLIEWDADIPAPKILLAEAKKAEEIIQNRITSFIP